MMQPFDLCCCCCCSGSGLREYNTQSTASSGSGYRININNDMMDSQHNIPSAAPKQMRPDDEDVFGRHATTMDLNNSTRFGFEFVEMVI